MRNRPAPPLHVAVLGTAAMLALSSCSSGGGGSAAPSPSARASTSLSPTPSSTVSVPPGVKLTSVGTNLALGQTATVIDEPNQKVGTVLQLTVKKASLGSMKDFKGFVLDDYTRAATPYYVSVGVKNVGEGDVGGTPVPLWGVDANDTLLPAATFTTRFPKCPSQPLPKTFGTGAAFDTCLVYLAPDHGRVTAVSFRPNQQFAPIQWKGDIPTPPSAPSSASSAPSSGSASASPSR